MSQVSCKEGMHGEVVFKVNDKPVHSVFMLDAGAKTFHLQLPTQSRFSPIDIEMCLYSMSDFLAQATNSKKDLIIFKQNLWM